MPPQVLTNMITAGFGNTASPSQPVSLTRSYSNDAANRLTGWNYNVNIYASSFPVQTDSYTYDNNGNRLTKQALLTGQEATPQQTSYAYDFEDRLNQLQYTNIPNITGTQTDNLTYNGDGLRVQANINSVPANYLYDGFNILVERDCSPPIKQGNFKIELFLENIYHYDILLIGGDPYGYHNVKRTADSDS